MGRGYWTLSARVLAGGRDEDISNVLTEEESLKVKSKMCCAVKSQECFAVSCHTRHRADLPVVFITCLRSEIVECN